MVLLAQAHPDIAQQFQEGNFVVHKFQHPFSGMAIDQAHEQNNALVKGDGGAVGLTENPKALQRWMVAGPEIARVIREFDSSVVRHQPAGETILRKHDQSRSVQVAFHKNVKALVDVLTEMGNPFLEKSEDILVLDSKDVAHPEMTNTVRQIQQIGSDQYAQYVTERLTERKTSIMDTIKKNKLTLFSHARQKKVSSMKITISTLRSDCSLFSRLYVASQTRNGNLDEFFAHENQPYPPSLSHAGNLNLGTKSHITQCL